MKKKLIATQFCGLMLYLPSSVFATEQIAYSLFGEPAYLSTCNKCHTNGNPNNSNNSNVIPKVQEAFNADKLGLTGLRNFLVVTFPVCSNGTVLDSAKNRCVSTQKCQADSIVATTPTSRFKINNNGTVTDTKTSLMWKRCSEGKSWSNCQHGIALIFTWQQALQQAQFVNNNGGFAGFHDWRVPNVKELISITEKQCLEPAINLMVFPSTPSAMFWSSSPSALDSHDAWDVGFGYGGSGSYFKEGKDYLRLVR